ncbi:GNAT family N-acetyltransferase [Sphingobacterium suaedae]|uniref:GNAT family N-acetyltransferase n=1 Tax=Sphingobacterium suaedae TaxID=1686402 RepID=A0ABW5KHG1_9SPHI
MKNSNKKVVLQKLTVDQADFLYDLYTHPGLAAGFDSSPFLENETPLQFTRRIISACAYIYSIRPAGNPDLLIGECALHGWDKQKQQVEIGGSLLPDYWGNGYMPAAFELLMRIAKHQLGVKTVISRTNIKNLRAIRAVQKIGFVRCNEEGNETILYRPV